MAGPTTHTEMPEGEIRTNERPNDIFRTHKQCHWIHLWLGAVLGDCAFSISARHKLKNALMMIGTIGPLELAGLAATYASTCRTRSVSVELARHRWKAVLTG